MFRKHFTFIHKHLNHIAFPVHIDHRNNSPKSTGKYNCRSCHSRQRSVPQCQHGDYFMSYPMLFGIARPIVNGGPVALPKGRLTAFRIKFPWKQTDTRARYCLSSDNVIAGGTADMKSDWQSVSLPPASRLDMSPFKRR